MFIFLIVMSILSILFGIYLNKNNKTSIKSNKNNTDSSSYKDIEKLYILDKRVEELEKLFLFEEDLDREDEIELIEKYEAEGYSIEEICDKLDMSKGEVLLLKKLKKDYLD